jgi:hypothetical protein
MRIDREAARSAWEIIRICTQAGTRGNDGDCVVRDLENLRDADQRTETHMRVQRWRSHRALEDLKESKDVHL